MNETVSLPLKITVGIILALVVAPLLVPVLMSISDTPYIVFPPRGFTLKCYGEVLANPEARGSFLFSLELATIVSATLRQGWHMFQLYSGFDGLQTAPGIQ